MQVEPITYVITEAQLVPAMQHHLMRRLTTGVVRWLLIVAGVFAGLAAVLIVAAGTRPDPVLIAAIVGAGGGILAVHLWVAPHLARRQFRQSAALRAPQSVTWDDAALRFDSERGHAVMPFAEFHGWSEADEVLMLYQTEMLFYPVPLPALGTAAENLRDRLIAAGVHRF